MSEKVNKTTGDLSNEVAPKSEVITQETTKQEVETFNNEVVESATELSIEEAVNAKISTFKTKLNPNPEFSETSENELKSGTPVEDIKDIKVNSEEVKDTPEKEVLYSKEFPAGTFTGNSLPSQLDIAREAGAQLLMDEFWTVSTIVREDGVTVQYVTKN